MKLGTSCSACGFISLPAFLYCGQCGNALDRPTAVHEDGAASLHALEGGRERRQLTVLFSDLVDSTGLAACMDPEDLGELLASYFHLCSTIYASHGGFIDREEGDSLRVYFGYRVANDDDACRAVRAALEVIDAVAGLGQRLGQRLQVRAGIATGEVVAGDPASADRPTPRVIGQTPNVAKRLQEAAQPGSVYISITTFRLVARHFEAELLGPLALKGLTQPVDAVRITGPKIFSGSIEQFDGRDLPPLIGRERELGLLEQQWGLACRGSGQAVLLEGEAGIGKSRLLHAFLQQTDRTRCKIMTAHCRHELVNSALFPFVDLLQRVLDITGDGDVEDKRAALAAAFLDGRLPEPGSPAIVSRLLSLPQESQPVELVGRSQREQTIEWLASWLSHSKPAAPTILIVEDIHWADASTLDCLGLLLDRIHSSHVLVLLTYRNEFVPVWPPASHLLRHGLPRITPADARGLAQHVAAAQALPDDLLESVVARSDGVPLFVEELTKVLVELRERGHVAMSDVESALVVPATLRGSLTARLDHLEVAKSIAQQASVIGREFNRSLLSRVSAVEESRLQRALDELVSAEMLFRRGHPPNESYVFKHVLVQEAAYLSLLRSQRAEYHARVADVLVEQFRNIAERHPELIAHHYAGAGMPLLAYENWYRAGRNALEASADVEAVGHLRMALHQLQSVTDGEARVAQEVDCLVTLGSALTAMRGYAAPEVEEAFARAHSLCEALGDTEKLYSALTGLHSFYQVRGSLTEAVAAAKRLVEIADRRGDRLARAQSHRCLGWSLFCIGDVAGGAVHLQVALDLFDRLHASEHARIHGAHPWVVGFVNMAYLQCFAGRDDEALEFSRKAIALARDLGQPLALAYALCMSAAVHCEQAQAPATLALADEAIELGLQHNMPYWVAWASTLRGWALVASGQHYTGLAVLETGLQSYRATGAQLFEASTLALKARCYGAIGDVRRALRTIELALQNPLVSAGYYYAPELHRLHGAWLLEAGEGAEAALHATKTAHALATSHGALGLVARAASQLAEMTNGTAI